MPSLLKQLQKAREADIAKSKDKKKKKEETLNEKEEEEGEDGKGVGVGVGGEEEEEEEEEEDDDDDNDEIEEEEITVAKEEDSRKKKQIDVSIVKQSDRCKNKSSISTSTSTSFSSSRRVVKAGKIHNAHQEFYRAMAIMLGQIKICTNHESLPNYQTSLARFHEMCPRFSETTSMDILRSTEYSHLQESSRVCLDYCGFGLFSYKQQIEDWVSSSFILSRIPANLCAHAIYGKDHAGALERGIYQRIMSYLKINEKEYSMVFTTSRGASFKLLADAYPFESCNRLVTMYDYESESVGMMVQKAKVKGVKVSNATFKWPSLRVDSSKLKKMLFERRGRRRSSAKGLFVFPVQSRISGVKYSYQWMSLAQQNKWHVLLDASAIGPKDMDSLGLSLFSPDFIIASFYKVFALDPSGFGCLFIKNSAIPVIRDGSGMLTSSDIVRLIPIPNQWSCSLSDSDGKDDEGNESEGLNDLIETIDFANEVPSFSGPMLGSHNHSASTSNSLHRLPRIKSVIEEEEDDDNESCGCGSVGGEITGQESISEEPFSGPFSGSFSESFSGPFSGSFNGICVHDGIVNRISGGSFTHELHGVSNYANDTYGQFQESTSTQSKNETDSNDNLDFRQKSKVKAPLPNCSQSAIRRETEGEFRLLGRRNGDGLIGTSLSPILQGSEDVEYGGETAFRHIENSIGLDYTQTEMGSYEDNHYYEENRILNDENGDIDQWDEPEVICQSLDHADMLGLNKATLRLRYLINWCVRSLLQLRHPGNDNNLTLVRVYGPHMRFERGASIAFNLYNCHGKMLRPQLVQMLADKNNISLSIGFLRNMKFPDPKAPDIQDLLDNAKNMNQASKGEKKDNKVLRIEVLTAALSILSNFEDVYRLWVFVARFLDADFVSKELNGHRFLGGGALNNEL